MNYCGVLNLDKPIGLTSRDVVDRVVRLVRPAKVGHAGTLDPLATGVLVVCVGHATRLISLAQEGRKRYLGRFVLGLRSDTDDITGRVTEGGDWSGISRDNVEKLLSEWTGTILQVPPQFSAVHVQGERAYNLARRGEAVELSARPVEVFSLRIGQFEPPEFELEIECGSGTYVRSIGRDIGARLGCGAVMKNLRRTRVGPFDIGDAVALESLNSTTIARSLRPARDIVAHLRHQNLTPDETVAVRRGQSIPARFESIGASEINPEDWLLGDRRTALLGSDSLLVGIGEFDHLNHRLLPRIVFPN